MTIKKPMKVKTAASAAPAAAGGAGGKAAISNRFKLNVPEEAPKKATLSGPAVTAAFITALVAIGVAGLLTFTLWKHWEFLMPV